MKVILASASERRQELLKRIVDDFEIKVSDFNEDIIPFNGNPHEYVMELALGKANDVAEKCNEGVIIGCDTIVTLDNEVLGKPRSEKEAVEMLEKLSGKSHEVYSGIAVIHKEKGEILKDFCVTKVEFSDINREEILEYVKSGDPMDKAGAYGIQGKAGVFVQKIEGDYYSVVGLPLNKLYKMLKSII
ncbi:Maf-like protein [Oceanirhabdus seepicola]|uniref:dTTP/UTP pyrophosphatase n=1 Tax=Oceanirhabdus seepicola TaxID=2828781 RepID=A0A9J6P502_9CLOT|nr:Maf-like protein [Oceanirhabdus seepicola]MCM1990712.1 Maf-like protein [Oceanirhabdus seepicola]